eukprot:gnl/MRDRNA2_/MRDRNA2_92052_c0_seq1.p1 gnl/MRDRNA2_/MRDRNA2_92052_c0~~gnl/MRDRNA2_/MRDRNA2_92052_c0_seq1.p1  ORF type:complete len:319 (-),score=63.08 gnl/MRDRNA2_/MRDRNA2_92052_c0_seq1:331-1287(-)
MPSYDDYNVGASPASPKRLGFCSINGPSPRDSPSMVGRRDHQASADSKRPAPVNPLAVKHKIWYGDCPGMVGARPKPGVEASRQPSAECIAEKARRSRIRKVQPSKRCTQLSRNEKALAMLPGQLLTAVDEAQQEAVRDLRQSLHDRLKNQTPGTDFITLKQLANELYNPSDGMSLEEFNEVAEGVLMAITLSSEGARRSDLQAAYTQWHKEKGQGRQKEERNKFAKYLERQENDITHRREKVIVVEEATAQFLDGVMQRKLRKFWPSSAFMREMNKRVRKKLGTNPPSSYVASIKNKHDSTRKLEQKTKQEPVFSAF